MVGHYRIIEKIGAGGMGEVYLAEDTKLNRNVALKFLPQHLCQDEDCRARFKREAQAAAKLNHPNIITIYEVSDYNGRPYFSMEYVEGRPLKDFIQDDGVTIEFAVDAALQLCEGLDKAHREGIVHRDIKPSNIIIDAEGRARLVDFGLATIRQDEKLTKSGSTLGTIGYMPPEQIKGKEADQRSDLFSLGVVLYEMLTGKQPFTGENEAATLNAILNDTPEPMARYKSRVPEELQRIVTKLIEKDPAFRYQTASGVISDLKKLIASKAAGLGKRYDWWNRYVVVGAVLILLIVTGYWLIAEFASGPPRESADRKKMLAVLPFENLGPSEDEYFADGVTDEITSRLAMVHSLGVISRTSAYAYKNSDKTLPEIAKELGVDYILEGTIRWDKTGDTDRVRITPQLIRVADDLHIWAANIEKAITGIFDVQIDIATRIVDTLGVTLLASERESMEYRPTDDINAYDLYLRAREYWDRKDYELAIPLLEKAIAIDSGFAKAHSLLARIHGFVYFNIIDPTEQRLQLCEDAAQEAERFDLDGIEGHLAMGYFYYYCKNDYDRALVEYRKVLEKQPNNRDVLAAIGFVQRRQGRWQEAARNFKRALMIDPHSQSMANSLAITLQCMREYEEMIRFLDQSLSLSPDAADLLFYKAGAMLELGKDSTEVREVLNQAIRYGDPDIVGFWMEGFDILFRDYESAVNRRRESGNFILADSIEFYLDRADIYRYWGHDSLSIIYYDSARIVAERRIQAEPDPIGFRHATLGLAYAGLGRTSEAVREGKEAVKIVPVSQDALYGPGLMEALANIYVMNGQFDLAIDVIDSLMSFPSGLGLYDLRHHPKYDPLRDYPRFQALLEKYSTQ